MNVPSVKCGGYAMAQAIAPGGGSVNADSMLGLERSGISAKGAGAWRMRDASAISVFRVVCFSSRVLAGGVEALHVGRRGGVAIDRHEMNSAYARSD
jgi:hypothetical protein